MQFLKDAKTLQPFQIVVNGSIYFTVKDFGLALLLVSPDMKTFILWKLTAEQQKLLGQKINWFTCFRKHHFCTIFSGAKLWRPHQSCPTCKIRRVISGELPLFSEITVHQVWHYKGLSSLSNLLFKQSLSLTELLS